jgi:hypothetical protein
MSRPCTVPNAALASVTPPCADDASLTPWLAGPGWYESTWELASGLEVTEVLHSEAHGARRAASTEWLSVRV